MISPATWSSWGSHWRARRDSPSPRSWLPWARSWPEPRPAAGGRPDLSDQRRRWLTTAAATQTALAAAAAIATAAGALGPSGQARFGLIALLGVAMGVQTATARKLAIPDLTTTVLTQTLTGLAADSSPASGDNPRMARRVTAVAAMLAGALAGGLLMVHAGLTATLAVTAGLFAAITIGFTSLTEEETH
jgi:uncharacterized membrane protein YoaK (UPF0700 family)